MKVPVQNHKKIAVQRAVLRFLYGGGVLVAGVVAPGLLRTVGSPNRGAAARKRLYSQIRNARYSLAQRGLVEENVVQGGKHFELTPKGRILIERMLMQEYRITEPVRWDGKWRVLIFDVRESRRRIRQRLRALLRGTGFVRLQDSVWVHPYPCEEFVELVRAHLASGVGELRSFTAEALESDRGLREHFNLL